MFYEVVSNKYFYLLAVLSREEKFKALRQVGKQGVEVNKWLLVMGSSLLFILIALLIHKYISKDKD
jgi:hypothetical protein